MALFQPFKATTSRPAPKFMQAALEQHKIDQMAKQHENQVRSQMYAGATDLGTGLYGEYKDEASPIGKYLREMTGNEVNADLGESEALPTDPNRIRGDALDPRGGAIDMGTEAAPTSLAPIQGDVMVAPPSDAPAPPTGDSGLFSDTYTPPADIGMAGAEEALGPAGDIGGAEEVAADDSIRGMLESAFAQFGGDAGTEAAVDAGTEKAAEGVLDKAGGSAIPGVGSLAALAQGDTESAALKYAASMLPPPYNMLAMFV